MIGGGKRELIALLNLSSWCLVMVERLFLAVPRGCLQFVIVVFPDHTHYFLHITEIGFKILIDTGGMFHLIYNTGGTYHLIYLSNNRFTIKPCASKHALH